MAGYERRLYSHHRCRFCFQALFSYLQRALDDDDIVLGLKMYESKMSQMQRKIAAQLAIMQKQKNRIEAIKFYLKRKGEDYEKDDLEGEITFDTDKAKESLQLASLDNLVLEVDHQETWQRVSDSFHSSFIVLFKCEREYQPVCCRKSRFWRYYPISVVFPLLSVTEGRI